MSNKINSILSDYNVPNPILSSLDVFTYSLFNIIRISFFIYINGKLRHRKVRHFAGDHLFRWWQSEDSTGYS